MVQSIFVTGGTGLTGANVCEQLVGRGDTVRALVRNPGDAAALTAIGVEVVQGDIADADDVMRASKGCESAIHCAALLGGASQEPLVALHHVLACRPVVRVGHDAEVFQECARARADAQALADGDPHTSLVGQRLEAPADGQHLVQ